MEKYSKIQKEKISSDLKNNFGINEGDTLFIRANLSSIGRIEPRDPMLYISAFLDAVGPEGTVVSVAFTSSSFLWKRKNTIFNEKTRSNAGSLSNLMISHPNSYRSKHPTNSFVAIGKYAKEITSEHTANSGAYDPIKKLIDLDAKMLVIGCNKHSPGFTTTHFAEVELGLHKKIIFPWLNHCLYEENGVQKMFYRHDPGSCSATYYRLYGHYAREEALFQGYIGKAYTLAGLAKTIYEIDLQVLRQEPKIVICNSPDCILCNARRWDTLWRFPKFAMKKLWKVLQSKIEAKAP